MAILGNESYGEGYDASGLPLGDEFKGIGILYGLTDDAPTVRTYLADGEDATVICLAARKIREKARTLSGDALGVEIDEPESDIVADLPDRRQHPGPTGRAQAATPAQARLLALRRTPADAAPGRLPHAQAEAVDDRGDRRMEGPAMICCVMPAAGGGIVGAIVVAIAAIYGIEWVAARIFWIPGSAAVIAAMVLLMRWARRRDALRLPLWRVREVPAQLYAEPVTELPRAERQVIENHWHVHHHYAGGPEPAHVTAIPGTAGDDTTEGN